MTNHAVRSPSSVGEPPTLYGVGTSVDEAVRSVIDVFWLFASQLEGEDPSSLAGPALSLSHFLEHVLGE